MVVLLGVISPAAAWVIPREFVAKIRRDFPQHTVVDAWDFEGIRRLLPDADVAFVPHVSRDMLASSPRLRWIQSPAVGVGHMLFPEMIASPVVITCARGIRARAIAEHVLGVTIALARQLHTAVRRQVEHRWAQDELESDTTSIFTLEGRRMGIVGLGSIGSEIASLAAAFGMEVWGVRRRLDQAVPTGVARVLPPTDLDDLLASSDVVVLAAPHTRSTDRLLGAREIALMRPDAMLVNISRGTIVDDEALVAALRSRRIAGAALDVFAHEPLDQASAYWDLPNVIVTPHTSGAMADYWTPLVALFSENLRRFEKGEPMLNVVDKVAGY
jgi:phosphoglycerate dehydrogenase-like enzyme